MDPWRAAVRQVAGRAGIRAGAISAQRISLGLIELRLGDDLGCYLDPGLRKRRIEEDFTLEVGETPLFPSDVAHHEIQRRRTVGQQDGA